MPRILIIDDDDGCRRTFKTVLEKRGFDILEAASAEEALDKFDSSVDLLLVDLVLPGMKGIELVQHVRQTSSVKVIAISGYSVYSPEPLENEFNVQSIDGFYAKGGKLRELTSMIDKVLEIEDGSDS